MPEIELFRVLFVSRNVHSPTIMPIYCTGITRDIETNTILLSEIFHQKLSLFALTLPIFCSLKRDKRTISF